MPRAEIATTVAEDPFDGTADDEAFFRFMEMMILYYIGGNLKIRRLTPDRVTR